MVHPGGQQGRVRRLAFAAVLALAASASLAPPAAAQSAIGFQGGVAVDPEQVFGGVYYMTGDLGRGIHLRPGIDGATGDRLRIGTVNLDFVYGYPLSGNGWTLIAGGGPSIVVTRLADVPDYRDTSVGFHSIIGFGHENGFFVEARLGSGMAQRLKLGIGWAVELK
ncbi:MAG: hypothetical protein U0P30_17945 [Vicinamibacterales bacterium]